MSAALPRLGRYVDLVLLGQGGMGAVYRGRDPDLDRPVAIKVVLDASPDFVERFRREAKAVARLCHPNIVQVYDFGQDDAGHPFFVMELVEGRPLDRLLEERGPLSPAEATAVLAQAAAGLQAAHDAGIVHRDIKPSNLILDGNGRVKLVDFGIARLENTPMLTTPSALLGTPTYMSPEQVEGKPVDGRTDVYSLGISAFHLLAGRPPFDAPEPIACALLHLHAPLPSLRERSRESPIALAALIERMCEKDPGKRPQSAREVAEEAEAMAAQLGGASRPLAAMAQTGAVAVAAGSSSTVPPTRAGGRAEPAPDAPSRPAIPMAAIGGVSALIAAAAVLGIVVLTRQPHPRPAVPPPPIEKKVVNVAGDVTAPAHDNGPIVEHAARPSTGPVRVAVLTFKNLGSDKDLDFLVEGIGETVLTTLAGSSREVSLLERNQVGAETGEIDFGQTKYVDRATAAALGRISGAEVAVQGAFQRAGKTVRVSARFVRIDSGEILDTATITRPAARPAELFAMQDAVADDLKAHILGVARRVRAER